jgi:uncharacterized protein (TIGR03435 family)
LTIAGTPSGNQRMAFGPEGLHQEYSKMSMPRLAELLTSLADGVPVIDMTEIKGNYQVAMDLPMSAVQIGGSAPGLPAGGGLPELGNGPGSAASDSDSRIAVMFEVVQKMGLKLEKRKIPMETIVVDHVEKTPTGN